MVGVPGKFVGCNTCREKRAKCDNERPVCKKCIKNGRVCGGYVRKRVFIMSTPQERGRCSSHPHRTLMAPQTKTRAAKLTKSRSFFGNLKQYNDPLVRIPNDFLNRMQCIALHTNILSLDPMHESSYESSTLPPLMDFLPELTRRSPTLETALRALYLIHMGVNRKDSRLVKESALINTQAMAKVRMAIMNPKTSTKIETLAASICLYLYEQVSCTRKNVGVWRILFRGATSLVQQRGPAAYKDFLDHHFFVRLFRNDAVSYRPRVNIDVVNAFVAMSHRKATFLADPAWCTVPWEIIPKNDMDRLFDIQVLLPGIFEREENLEKLAPSANRRQQAKALLAYCEEVDKKFQDWSDELHARAKKPLFWAIPRQEHTQESAKALGFNMCNLFPQYIQFADLNTCFLHMYYWAGLSLFYRKMQHIHRFSNEEVRVRSSRSPDDSATEIASTGTKSNMVVPHTPDHSYQSMLASPSAPSMPTDSRYQIMLAQASIASTSIPTETAYQTMSTPGTMPCNSSYLDHLYQSNLVKPLTPPTQLSYDSALPKTIRSTLPPPPPTFTLSRTSSSSPQPTEGTARLDDKYTESSILDLGILICKSLPFALHRTLRSLGPDHSAWPLWTALQGFKRRGYTEEIAWCQNMMEMWEREGWKFGINIGRVEWKEYHMDDMVFGADIGRK